MKLKEVGVKLWSIASPSMEQSVQNAHQRPVSQQVPLSTYNDPLGAINWIWLCWVKKENEVVIRSCIIYHRMNRHRHRCELHLLNFLVLPNLVQHIPFPSQPFPS